MILELHRAVSNITKVTPIDQNLSPAGKSKMQVELAVLILQGVPWAVLASVLTAMMAMVVGWGVVDSVFLSLWGGAVVAVAIARIGLWRITRARRPTLAIMIRFKTWNMVGIVVNGVLWGMLAPLFAVYGQIGHVFLPFALAGMAAVAIVSAGACWRCVMAFNIPAIVPMAATFFIWGGEGAMMIGAVIILYGILTSVLALQTSRMISRSAFLRSKNIHLTQEFEARVDETNEAGKRFKAIVESSRELTLIFSLNGQVTYASPAAQEILGQPPEALVGMTSRELFHEDDLPQFRATGEQALSALGEVRILRHICIRSRVDGFVPMSGRLTNFLYVPGIEGFVFAGTPQTPDMAARLHAAQ